VTRLGDVFRKSQAGEARLGLLELAPVREHVGHVRAVVEDALLARHVRNDLAGFAEVCDRSVEIAPLRERYEALIADPAAIERQLRDGAARLRERYALPRLRTLREAVGLRDLAAGASAERRPKAKAAATLPAFKQYRETDGRFYFKLVDGERVLLQSVGFDSPKDAGVRIGALRRGGFAGTDEAVALGDGVDAEAVRAALAALQAADAEKA